MSREQTEINSAIHEAAVQIEDARSFFHYKSLFYSKNSRINQTKQEISDTVWAVQSVKDDRFALNHQDLLSLIEKIGSGEVKTQTVKSTAFQINKAYDDFLNNEHISYCPQPVKPKAMLMLGLAACANNAYSAEEKSHNALSVYYGQTPVNQHMVGEVKHIPTYTRTELLKTLFPANTTDERNEICRKLGMQSLQGDKLFYAISPKQNCTNNTPAGWYNGKPITHNTLISVVKAIDDYWCKSPENMQCDILAYKNGTPVFSNRTIQSQYDYKKAYKDVFFVCVAECDDKVLAHTHFIESNEVVYPLIYFNAKFLAQLQEQEDHVEFEVGDDVHYDGRGDLTDYPIANTAAHEFAHANRGLSEHPDVPGTILTQGSIARKGVDARESIGKLDQDLYSYCTEYAQEESEYPSR